MQIIAAILIVGIIIFVYFWTTNTDISFGISLIDENISEGTDAVIHYKIENGWFSSDKTGVMIYYYITSEGENDEQVLKFGTIYPRGSREGVVVIPTSDLSPGKYTVRTDLEYHEFGKGLSKFLTLELTIY